MTVKTVAMQTLRQGLGAFVREACAEEQKLVLTHRGRPVAVLVPCEDDFDVELAVELERRRAHPAGPGETQEQVARRLGVKLPKKRRRS